MDSFMWWPYITARLNEYLRLKLEDELPRNMSKTVTLRDRIRRKRRESPKAENEKKSQCKENNKG